MIERTFEVSGLIDHATVKKQDFTVKDMVLHSPTWYKINMYNLLEALYIKAEYNHRGTWKTARLYTNLEYKFRNKEKVILVDEQCRGNVKEFLKETVGPNIFVSKTSKTLNWYRSYVLGNVAKKDWRAYIVEWQKVTEQILSYFTINHIGVEKTTAYLDWLEKHKAALKANRSITIGNHKVLNKQEGEVTIGYARPTRVGKDFTFEKAVFDIKELAKTPHMVIVFDDTEREQAKQLASCLIKEKAAIIGKREWSKIKQYKQFKLWKEFMEQDTKPFRRLATALLINKLLADWKAIYGRDNEIVNNCLTKIATDIAALHDYKSKNGHYMDNHVQNTILETAEKLNLWDVETQIIVNRVKKALDTFSFLKYIETPRSWDTQQKAEINKMINQMLLFKKKYAGELEDYQLQYVAPAVPVADSTPF